MSLGRRDFIIGTVGAAATASLLDGCDDSGSDPKPDAQLPDAGSGQVADLPVDTGVFAHGVASGDPMSDRVIIWTRVSAMPVAAVYMEWTVARDPALREVVQSTQIGAHAELDYTVKVDVSGLEPGTTYYYAFSIPGSGIRSVIGRTRTLPRETNHARLAFTSCSNYQNGYFNAYRAIAQRHDLDLWIHLGDYIYEYGNGQYGSLAAERPLVPPTETITLADYRARYAHYRSDPDLQEVHRQHPLIVVWDDHEFANNAYEEGAQNHNPELGEGPWIERKRAASQAFFEWLPIRPPAVTEPVPRIFRSFAFGDLFDLIMLDTRIIGRDQQAGLDTAPGVMVGDPSVWLDESRQILGSEQEAWFLESLSASRARGATWRLIGNQVIFSQTRSPLDAGSILFSDFWDGYQPARTRVIDHILSQGIQNIVFLTGDIHSSWAMELSKDPFATPRTPPFAVELVGPSVTSMAFEGDPTAEALVAALLGANPQVKFGEVTRKGYVLVDLTPERMQAEWYFVTNPKLPNVPSEELFVAYTCVKDTAQLALAAAPSPSKLAIPPA